MMLSKEHLCTKKCALARPEVFNLLAMAQQWATELDYRATSAFPNHAITLTLYLSAKVTGPPSYFIILVGHEQEKVEKP